MTGQANNYPRSENNKTFWSCFVEVMTALCAVSAAGITPQQAQSLAGSSLELNGPSER